MKKRIFSVLLAFAMIFTLMPTALAAPTTYQVVTVDKTTVQAGETVNVKVTLPEGIETAGSFTVNLKFDTGKFEVIQRQLPPTLTATNEDFEVNENVSIVANGKAIANTSGELTANAAYVYNTIQVAGVTVIDATLKAKTDVSGVADFSFTIFEITKSEGGTQYIVKKDQLETPPSVTIPKAPITSVSFTLADPAKGVALPSLNGLGGGYTGAVEWYKGDTATGAAVSGLAEGDQVYTAKVTLAADTSAGENFADSVTVPTDYTKVSNDGTKLVLTRTFGVTARNNPLKGSVTIDKTNPKLGDTLTAAPALDYNGETAGTLSYQWYRGDTAIPSATGSSYPTVAADVDKTIKVEVKNSNNSESVFSAPTAAVARRDYTGSAAIAALTDNAHRWDTKIEITNVTEGQEYAITTDATEPIEGWQNDGVFDDLKKETNYTVYTRVRATPTVAASTSVTTSVKTKKAMYPLVFDLSGLTSVYYYNGSAQNPSISYKPGYSAATVGGLTFKYEKNDGSDTPVSECKLPGAYRVNIVTDNNGSDYAAGESFVGVFSISPGNLTATDFQVTGLTTYDYDGNSKKATVEPKSGVAGVGAYTVYYEGIGTTSYTRQTAEPTDAGSYKVSVDVETGDCYNGINNLELGTLTINKINYFGTMTFAETVRSGQPTTDKTLTLPALPAGASYGTPVVGGTTPALISAQSVSGTTLTYSTTNKTDGTSATITIPVTGATNYNNYSIVVTVTAKDKEDAGVNITTPPTSKTYGDADFTLTATKTAPNGGTWSWNSSNPDILEIISGADTATPTIKVKKADATGATLTVSYTSDTHYGSANATITVAQKEVTVAVGDYKVSKEYDSTTGIGTPSGTLSVSGILSGDMVVVTSAPVAYMDANVGGQSTMDVNITLVGSGNANYKIKGGATTISVPCEITAKDVKLTGGINATDRSYEKDNKTVSLTKGTLTFNGVVSGEM